MTSQPIDVPEFCRLELWTGRSWSVAHAGVSLLHPRRYPERLAAKGRIGRVTILDTGEIIQSHCQYCSEAHQPPFDGSCLL